MSRNSLPIVSVREILDGQRMNLPMYAEVTKKARGDSGAQQNQFSYHGSDE